jgi:hypothetical protein
MSVYLSVCPSVRPSVCLSQYTPSPFLLWIHILPLVVGICLHVSSRKDRKPSGLGNISQETPILYVPQSKGYSRLNLGISLTAQAIK